MSALGHPDPDSRRNIIAQQLEALGDEPHIVAIEDGNIPATDNSSPDKLSTDAPSERARDESGKFVAKDTKTDKVKEPELPLEVSSPASAPAPVVEPPLWERPPASWKKDYQEPWKSVDPKVRQYVWEREEQMNAGVMPLKEKAKLADAINQVAEPYMNTIRGMGIDLPKAVQGLMYADNVLRTAPRDQAKQYLMELAKSYGIQLGDGVVDPNATQADPYIYQVRNELNSVRGEIQAWKQQQEEAASAAKMAEINRFKLKAEYFDEALPTMQMLANAGISDDIEVLYNKAIRLDEDLSEKIQQRTQAQQIASQSAAADKAAKAAKAAAVSVKTSTPGATTTSKAQDRRAVLEEAFSGIDARL